MAFPSCCTLLTACCFVGNLHSWRAHCELFKVDLIYTHQEEYRFGFLDDQYLHKETIFKYSCTEELLLVLFWVCFLFCFVWFWFLGCWFVFFFNAVRTRSSTFTFVFWINRVLSISDPFHVITFERNKHMRHNWYVFVTVKTCLLEQCFNLVTGF